MYAAVAFPETMFEPPIARPVEEFNRPAPETGPKPAATQSNRCAAVLRAGILLALGAGALALILFSLVPAVLLALVLLLPALAPLILVGLGFVFVGDAERSRAQRTETLDQPCSCHHDRMLRALQNG